MFNFILYIFGIYYNIFDYYDLGIFNIGDDAGVVDFYINLYDYENSSFTLSLNGSVAYYLAMLCTIITLILLLYMVYKICKLIICRIANV